MPLDAFELFLAEGDLPGEANGLNRRLLLLHTATETIIIGLSDTAHAGRPTCSLARSRPEELTVERGDNIQILLRTSIRLPYVPRPRDLSSERRAAESHFLLHGWETGTPTAPGI